ncbi:TetR/AcrR family transcriptional regulator [Deinococcus enclensis]|uniref:AcrR family transcriptional regulator n=1 Tax=Deinococcus enclensis TaxID=1049582 RepID=A0ABT9MC32_9DEIO|nr:TetR/AcrR family transcriptional regulator [Deinococcus enclensis]MDP9764091.1 AcrR family transcriptional regulator [Deinococcus enclensis]
MTTPTPRRRRLQAQDRRTQILDQAAALFIERGFEGVSMADIALALHTSRPTIYTYFPSTEAILAELLDRRLEHLPERLAQHLHTEDLTAFSELFQAIVQESELLKLLHSGGGPQFRSRRAEFLSALQSRLNLEQLPGLKGETLNAHPLLLPLLLDLITQVAYRQVTDPAPDPDGLLPLLNTFIRGGVHAVAAHDPHS